MPLSFLFYSYNCVAWLLLLLAFAATPTTANLFDHQDYRDDETITAAAADVSNNSTDSIDENRIIGGTNAAPGQYPFYVHWKGCGASLIHPDIILGAAHCNVIIQNVVFVGAYTSGNSDTGAAQRNIVFRQPHPLYNALNANYDFLVMKLDSPAPQKPIPLNSNPNYPVVNQPLTVIGLGLTSDGGQPSSTLLQVTLPYNDQKVCSRTYGSTVINSAIQFCAGGLPQGGKDSCQGDSGGPMFDSNKVLVGVVSTGDGCAIPNVPGIYGRVSGVLDWINQQICLLSSNPPASCAKISLPPPTVRVRVDVLYDNRPDETAWSIRNRKGIIFYRFPFGKGTAGKTVTTYVPLIPGQYTFYMRDNGGNGICCNDGNGNYGVFIVSNNRIRRVVRGDGQFQFVQRHAFVVPSNTNAGDFIKSSSRSGDNNTTGAT